MATGLPPGTVTQGKIHYTRSRAWNPNPEEDDECTLCHSEEHACFPDEYSEEDENVEELREGERYRDSDMHISGGHAVGSLGNIPRPDHHGHWIDGKWVPDGFQLQERVDALGFPVTAPKKHKVCHNPGWMNMLLPEPDIPDFSIVPSTAPLNTILLIPRGIQIMAKNSNYLEKGFHYPKELQACNITQNEWNAFCYGFTAPIRSKHKKANRPMMPFEIENMLDLVANWDIRPKGFVVRLDMPGEQKYGLDFMDLHHGRAGRKCWDNVLFSGKDQTGVTMMRKHSNHHHWRIRRRYFNHPRIVIDSIEMLVNGRAQERGWTNWIRACTDSSEALNVRREMDCNEPSHYAKFERRKDRWPASKHLFADRFRGSDAVERKGSGPPSIKFIPDPDSMDQRGGTVLFPKAVVACDDIYHTVLKRGCPEDKSILKPCGMVKCPEGMKSVKN